jgi:CheY-like chemotaxis protein
MEITVDNIAKLISAISSLAWSLVLAILLFKLFEPIRSLIESARARKFTLKIAGNELTMEEVSEQQLVIISDLQRKVADIEKSMAHAPTTQFTQMEQDTSTAPSEKRILWVDDKPRNISFLVASLEKRGARVETALSTKEGLTKFRKRSYDIVLSDMARTEGGKAGIDLTKKLKDMSPNIPVFIYCTSWAARNLRKEALEAGVTEITSSASTLLAALPLNNEA